MYEKKILKEISMYLAITFTLTWGIWFLALSDFILRISNVTLIAIGTFIPSFAGLLMEYKLNGVKGFIKSAKAIVNPKISLKWYVYIFGVMPTVMLLSYTVLQLSARTIPNSELVGFPLSLQVLEFQRL